MTPQSQTREQEALNLLIQAADLAPLPGPQRRQWEEAARVLMAFISPPPPETGLPVDKPAG